MRFKTSSQEDLWQQLRRRILAETSSFLSAAIERPELGVSIPIVMVGKGRFSQAFASEFWRQVLDDE